MNDQRYRQHLTIIVALTAPIIPFAIIGEMPGDERLWACDGAGLRLDALLGPGLIIPMLLPVLAWSIWRWAASR